MDIEVRHLSYFVAVAEAGSFNGGAQALGISQPTLTRQLNLLEQGLGVRLLERSPNGVRTTAEGQTFLQRAQAILAEHKALTLELRSFTRFRLRIGYITPSLFGPSGQAIAETGRQFPDVTIEIVEAAPGTQFELLRAGKIDIALVGHCPDTPNSDIEIIPLYPIPLDALLCADHPLADHDEIPLTALASQPFVGLDPQLFPGRQQLVSDTCARAGFSIGFAEVADSLVSLLSLVGQNRGVSLIPRDAARIAAHAHVKLVPLQDCPAVVHFHAARRTDPPCPASVTLLRLCTEYGSVSA